MPEPSEPLPVITNLRDDMFEAGIQKNMQSCSWAKSVAKIGRAPRQLHTKGPRENDSGNSGSV